MQALICCQDWIRSGDDVINMEENIKYLKEFDDGKLVIINSFSYKHFYTLFVVS